MGIEMEPVLYRLVISFIKFFKFLQYTFYSKVIPNLVESKVKESYGKVGVNFQESRENISRNNDANSNYCKNKSCDIIVHNENFYGRAAAYFCLGMGESYMEGWWDCDDLVELCTRSLRSQMYLDHLGSFNRMLNHVEFNLFNLQTQKRSIEVAKKHYNLGNDLFEIFLDPYMNYTCGYWPKARNLEEAQIHKMDLIAKKLKLKPGMRVLDLGCGWGGLCRYLAEHYGVECVGVTISAEGVKYGRRTCRGLPVAFKLMDYRDIVGEKDHKFDRVVSIGMMEHVGRKNYKKFFEVAYECLNDDGLLLVHTIGNNTKELAGIVEPFMATYIFPNASVPYTKDITEFSEGLFVLEDWHNFGDDYCKTLIAWNDNFVKNWGKIEDKYGEKFYRLWTYYLLMSAGAFKSRINQLWQMVFTKDSGMEGGYISVR